MKTKKFAKFAAASLLGLSSAAICEIYRYAFCRNPGILERFEKKGHDGEYYLHRDSKAAELAARSFIRHSITSSRGDTLAGYYYMSGSKPSGKIAFIVHGFRSDHLDAAGMYYEYYLSRGIDVFLCDNAGTGESSGNHIGYDVYESEDCLKWLDFLRHEYGEDIRVLLHGFSMGGATVLRMSDVCPPQVRFIVSDSGYSSAVDIMRRRVGIALYGFSALNYLLAGYKLSETDVRAHVAKSRVPILFVHGREDSTVPFSMGEELYNLCPGEKDYLWVDDARHVESMHRAPQAYEAKLDSFIKKYM
jgi:uncharacterized protein